MNDYTLRALLLTEDDVGNKNKDRLAAMTQKRNKQSEDKDPLKCRTRNDEIREWFLLHGDDLDSFVVIDDSLSGEFAEQSCAIVTRVNEGLTQHHVDSAISALSVRTDKEKILQSLHCKV